VKHKVAAGRQQIYDLANHHSLPAVQSATNFVAVDMGSAERATRMMKALHDRDVFIRMPGVAPLNRCIRIGVGTAQEHAVLQSAFTDAIRSIDRSVDHTVGD
jgi:histidinol-phosphate aminotransferase